MTLLIQQPILRENPCENNVEETVEPLSPQKIFQVLNKMVILENEILNIDPDTERELKLQRGLDNLFSGYQELYKQLLKKKSQTLVTQYFQIKEKKIQLLKIFRLLILLNIFLAMEMMIFQMIIIFHLHLVMQAFWNFFLAILILIYKSQLNCFVPEVIYILFFRNVYILIII